MHNIVKSKVNWNDLGKFREKLGYATFRKNDFSKKIPFGDNQAKKKRERERENHVYLWYNEENDLRMPGLVESQCQRNECILPYIPEISRNRN